MIRQAVILAAGKGTRLRAEGDELPKPLHVVGGMPLIKRTIMTLNAAGVTKVVVVTGFQAEAVRASLLDPAYAAAGIEIVPVHNADFEKANGISVLVGGSALTGPFMLSMADHMYTPAIAKLVASQDMTTADLFLATDVRTTDILDIDDATKVRSEGGHIVEIGKQLTSFDRIDCGVFAVTQRLLEELTAVRAEKGDCSLTDGVRRLAETRRARVADIGDELWQDVDTPEDRAHAEQVFKGRDPLNKP